VKHTVITKKEHRMQLSRDDLEEALRKAGYISENAQELEFELPGDGEDFGFSDEIAVTWIEMLETVEDDGTETP